jgi:ATP synthase protein I
VTPEHAARVFEDLMATKPDDLNKLDARLKTARGKTDTESAPRGRGTQSGLGQGLRIGIEMVVSVAVGAGIGYFIDNWAETTPLFMIVFLFLGFAAGIMNVLRIARGLDEAVGFGRAMREKEARDKLAQDEELRAKLAQTEDSGANE